MTRGRTLIAGFGNLLLGDDGFGIEVVRRLAEDTLPDGAEILEVGIGGMELVYELMNGCETLVIVDAVRRGHPPGTLYVFQPSEADLTPGPEPGIDPHFAEPTRAMKVAKKLGYLPADVTIVGCEPLCCDLDLTLSPEVRKAVEPAAERVRALLAGDRSRRQAAHGG
ncbi:MAG: hydrogenase maturation protease [Acidobacteria bacterium]|nr:hydrogenase maturation protease [Acidobacteriota bacterium]